MLGRLETCNFISGRWFSSSALDLAPESRLSTVLRVSLVASSASDVTSGSVQSCGFLPRQVRVDDCERFAHWYLCRRGAYVRLALEAIGTYFIKTVNGLLLRVHKIDACSQSRECFSNNLGSHAYAGGQIWAVCNRQQSAGTLHCIPLLHVHNKHEAAHGNFEVQGTRHAKAAGNRGP